MAYSSLIKVEYLDGDRTQTAEFKGRKLSLRLVLIRLRKEHPNLGPKHILGVCHDDDKPFDARLVQLAVGEIFGEIPVSEINFFAEEDAFLCCRCPVCSEKIDLSYRIDVEKISVFLEIVEPLKISCPACGIELGVSIVSALNGAVRLMKAIFGFSRADHEDMLKLYVQFQLSLSQAVLSLGSTASKDPQRAIKVVMRRYGFWTSREQTLAELAGDLGVVKERVRQVELKALRNLRHPTRTRLLTGRTIFRRIELLVERLESQARTIEHLESRKQELKDEVERLKAASLGIQPTTGETLSLLRQHGLSKRAFNALSKHFRDRYSEVVPLAEVLAMAAEEVLLVSNFGPTSLAELCQALKNAGLHLKGE